MAFSERVPLCPHPRQLCPTRLTAENGEKREAHFLFAPSRCSQGGDFPLPSSPFLPGMDSTRPADCAVRDYACLLSLHDSLHRCESSKGKRGGFPFSL